MRELHNRKLILFTSLSIALIAACISSAIRHFSNESFSVFSFLGITFVIFITSVLVINYVFRKFFFANLRTIYRNIFQLTSPRHEPVIKPVADSEIMNELDRLLTDWEKNKEDEIGELRKLENYRKEFLGNVSHELKTPIFNVQGYLHTLIDGGIEDADVNMHYLIRASKSLDRLISIVDDLESISKLESGNLILEQRTFDICDLSKEIIESLEMQAKEKKIKLSIVEGSDKQLYVHADKERLRQVLVNLMVNSIKYGRPGGTTSISFSEDNESVLVNVSDDGIGVDKEHLPRLFERFYRVDKSRSREQGGTGLGLAIVKHIVEAHGQKISVQSEPASGTIFSFTLTKSK